MDINQAKCPNCAGELWLSPDRGKKVCPYCDAVFPLSSAEERRGRTGGIDGKQWADTEWKNDAVDRKVEEMVREICVSSGFDSVYGIAGYSLVNYSKYQKAKANFGIADGEEVYLIFDATVLGNCKKGFAVCTTGLYYCEAGREAYVIRWDKFKGVKIEKKMGSITIANAEFNTGTDNKPLYQILVNIQNCL